MTTRLDFEKPIIELEKKIEELKTFTSREDIDLAGEIKRLEDRLRKVKQEVYKNLTPWQRVQIARHPKRPYTLDYIDLIMTDFIEIHGDRQPRVAEPQARDGYRKAIRVMKLAEKFNLPIVIFIDTPGAYPGIGAEERGQAEAIARNMYEMCMLKTPIIVFVIGEGGSGGALGIGVGDRTYMLEHAYYSVISPEGCAAILWKERLKAPNAAEALKLTSEDLSELGIIDGIVKEPLGGAHRGHEEMAQNVKTFIKKDIASLCEVDKKELVKRRYDKFRKIGKFKEGKSK